MSFTSAKLYVKDFDALKMEQENLQREIEEWKRNALQIEAVNKELIQQNTQLMHSFNLSPADVKRVEAKVRELNAAERRAVGDSFTRTVSQIQKDMAEAKRKRDLAEAARVRTTKVEAIARRIPVSSSPMVIKLYPGTRLVVQGWSYGEALSGNDIWFYAENNKIWVWSGSFDNPSTTGIPQIAYIEEVKQEQKRLGVAADGIIGPETLLAMRRARNNIGAQISASMRHTYSDIPISRPDHFVNVDSEIERLARVAAEKVNPRSRKYVRTQEGAKATGQPIGSVIMPKPETVDPKDVKQMEALTRIERERQANMGYRVGPHPWFFGYRLVVDRHDGKRQEFWRPTKEMAERTGHRALEKYVMRRRRLWDAANPKLVTARDRWIVEPTQAEQTAKEQAEWDSEFQKAEEGKK